MTIESSKASAMAAFRAGRVAGRREALAVLVDMLDEPRGFLAKYALMNACERISALSKDEPNDRNLTRDSELERAVMEETGLNASAQASE